MNAFFLLFRRFIWRDLLKNRVRSTLTVLGIALGVAVMLAIYLANSTALGKFQESIDLVAGKSNMEIRAISESDLNEQVLASLHELWDENVKFTPIIDQLAIGAESPHEVMQVLGIDIFADYAFRSMKIDQKSQDSSGLGIFKENHAYVGEAIAQRFHLKAGDSFKVLINDSEQKLFVEGIIAAEGVGKAFSGNVMVMDIGCAQKLFSMPGRISRVDMIVPDAKFDAVEASLKKRIPPGVIAERPQRRGQQVEKMLKSFQYNLTALSLIALLVGMFLIYNTMSISVIRRRWEIGTLRAIGLPAVEIFSLFALEAAVLGAIGSALGLALGVFFAQFAVKAVAGTVQTMYADQPGTGLVVSSLVLVLAFVGGTLFTVAAAIAPAIEAVSIAPAEASRRASYERKVQRLAPLLTLIGITLYVVAMISAMQKPIAGFPFFGYLAAACAAFGTAAFSPLILDKVLKTLSILLEKILGTEARLAALSLHGALGRSSVTVASLMVGISMMVSLAIMIGSFRHTVITWVEQTLKADLWIEPVSRKSSSRTGRLAPDVVKTIRRVSGIDAVDAFLDFPIEYDGDPCNLGAGELDVMRTHGNLMFENGERSSEVLNRVDRKDSAIISESFSIKHGKHKGDILTLNSPSGPFNVKVEGVYYDYASDTGYIVLGKESFVRHFGERQATTLAVFLQKNQNPEAVRADILEQIPENTRLIIRTNNELKTEVLRVFDKTFSITYALHAIAITVAILGVMNALFALTMESRRDLGILKYLGASEIQVKKLVLVQAGILGSLGNLGGLILGFVLSFLLIHVINKQSFGWTIQLDIPAEFLLESFALIFFCSLASGFIPAGIAAKTPAPEVVRSE